MSDPYREQIERFLNDDLPPDEAERLAELIDTDPQVSRLYDELALESVFLPRGENSTLSTEIAPANPELEQLIKRQLAQSRHAELWSLRTNKSDQPHTLLDKTLRIASTAVCVVRDGGEQTAECELPVTIERVQDDPPTFRLACDWPADYEPMGIKLSRLKTLDREPFERTLRFQSLADEIAARPTPASNQTHPAGSREPEMTLAADTLDAESLSGSNHKTVPQSENPSRPTFHEAGFRVQCDLRLSSIKVCAVMPPGRTTDLIVSEVEYESHDGQPVVNREALRMQAVRGDSNWSSWKDVAMPDPDNCASPEITIRFRSLRDSDLYLLNTNELDEVFTEHDATLLPASKIEPGSFEFSTDLKFEREAASVPDVTWSLQMTRKAREDRHA